MVKKETQELRTEIKELHKTLDQVQTRIETLDKKNRIFALTK
jgi:cell division protein FtsL